MGSFNGFYQSDEGNLVDGNGNALVIESDGSLNVNATITATEVEIANDTGNPIPVTGTLTSSPALLVPLGYEQITVSSIAVGLTVPATSEIALIQNETNGKEVRWRDDGTDPTSAVGIVFAGGTIFEYNGDLSAFKLIRKSSSDSTINVSYYKYA